MKNNILTPDKVEQVESVLKDIKNQLIERYNLETVLIDTGMVDFVHRIYTKEVTVYYNGAKHALVNNEVEFLLDTYTQSDRDDLVDYIYERSLTSQINRIEQLEKDGIHLLRNPGDEQAVGQFFETLESIKHALRLIDQY
jgi:hypothetical protein